jgi:hypothetical protein
MEQVMKAIQLSEKEITYAIIALRRYEQALLAEDGVDMEDTATDLIIVQSLIERLGAAKRDDL